MAFVIPQVALQRVIQEGLSDLKSNQAAFNEIFDWYTSDEMNSDYGSSYVSQVWEWFINTKIPVVQSWSFNTTRIPSISIHLAQETEDETKAAVGDYFGEEEDNEVGIGVFTVNLDIGLHASKTGDQVLWMHYIVSYILYKKKLLANSLGLRLHTFSASDYNKESKYMADNIWTRWLRFRCTVEHHWGSEELVGPFDDVDVDLDVQDVASEYDIQNHTQNITNDDPEI